MIGQDEKLMSSHIDCHILVEKTAGSFTKLFVTRKESNLTYNADTNEQIK